MCVLCALLSWDILALLAILYSWLGGGSRIIWPLRFMIPAFFPPQWFMIHLQFYFNIHDSFVHDTLCLNVSNSFSYLIKYPQLNESPKLKSQEKRYTYRRRTLSWLCSSPHVSVVMVTTKKIVYVFRAKRCQSPRISILEVIIFVLHTTVRLKTIENATLWGLVQKENDSQKRPFLITLVWTKGQLEP